MFFGGAFHLYLASTIFQFIMISYDPFYDTMIGVVLLVALGFLTFCASMLVWFQSSWAVKVIAVVGIAACVTAVIGAYYMMIVILAPLYWYAIKWIRTSRIPEVFG